MEEGLAEMSINPQHYRQGEIEVIDFILDQKMDYLTANVQKYIARWRFKEGIEDLRKARWFWTAKMQQELKKKKKEPNPRLWKSDWRK